jgi:hypothetical protein
MTHGPFAIRPAFGVHLQEPQIDPELDLLDPILGLEPAHHDLARLVFPVLQQARYVEIHNANMDGRLRQVNAVP